MAISPPPPTQQPFNHDRTHLGLLNNCRTPLELKQLHAAAIKTNLIASLPVSSRLLSLYSRPDLASLDQATAVLRQIPQPDSFAWNTVITRHVDAHQSHTALDLFRQMLIASSAAPDNFTLPSVIKCCARLSSVHEGKQLHGLSLKSGFASDAYTQSSLVSFYSKCGDLDSAREVFNKIPVRDSVAWNSLIDGYARSGRIEAARNLFDEMPERDSFSWTSMISGYSKHGEVGIARELFDRMSSSSRSSASWNAMIDGYMRCGDFGTARELFGRMSGKNIITWNLMIAGFERMGHFEEAIRVYETMLAEEMVPNTVTLVGALSAVSGSSLLEKGRSIYRYMRRNRFKLDGVLGTCLIEMYSKCGSIEDSLAIFSKIRRKKVGHWTAMIVGLGMHGMAERALDLFSEMERMGVKPIAITFVGLLNACSHAGMVNEGRQYFEIMPAKYGINPSLEHYGCLVDLLCRVGQLEEARDVISQMPMKPNKVIWMSLLSGCRKYGKIEIGEFAAKRVIELSPESTGCYVLLSNIYATYGIWDKVSKLRETMKERRVRKDPGRSVVEHGDIVHEFIVGDRSHPQADEIYSKLSEMNERLKFAGHTPDISQVLLCVEDGDKEAELAHHSERLAIAFGLINVEPGLPLRVVKNLRVCNDCHNVTKLLSGIYRREIIVRDNSRFHHFRNGSCSCMDFW